MVGMEGEKGASWSEPETLLATGLSPPPLARAGPSATSWESERERACLQTAGEGEGVEPGNERVGSGVTE